MLTLFEVGGCVRDKMLGLRAKDVDFVVVATGGYEEMRNYLLEQGFRIYLENPEFVTIRAGVPLGHKLRERTKDADFVLARKDGPSSDGRRPDFVEPGTLEDDLARRDFTVNAMAQDPFTGAVFDPHGGRDDLRQRELRFVGDAMTRIREDGLRVLRALRFSVTKDFSFAPGMWKDLVSEEALRMLSCVSVERVREEVEKMFAHDTLASLRVFSQSPELTAAVFRNGLRLSATLKQ